MYQWKTRKLLTWLSQQLNRFSAKFTCFRKLLPHLTWKTFWFTVDEGCYNVKLRFCNLGYWLSYNIRRLSLTKFSSIQWSQRSDYLAMMHKIWSSIIFDRLTWHKLFSDHSCSSKPFIRPDSSRFVSVRIMSVLCVSSSFVFKSSSKSWRQRPRYDWCPNCSTFSTVFRFTYTKDWPLINPGVKNFGRSVL